VHMVTVKRATGAVALRARAPIQGGFHLDPYTVMSVWDSMNQKVIYPVMSDVCGKIRQMLVYHPATDTWQDFPVPANTHGRRSATTRSGTSSCWPGACSPRGRPRTRRACTSGGTGPSQS
jgi:hypothetical protein